MGLFSKKPKSIIVQRPPTKASPEHDALDHLDTLLPKVEPLPSLAPPPTPKLFEAPPPKPDKPDKPAAQVTPPRPAKPPKKNKKFTVDPTDFLALRAELIDVKARLDESEQQRAIVEARLGSLDAAAAAFTNERNDITEVANMVLQLQEQVDKAGTATADAGTAANGGVNDELSAKVDALQNRLFGLQDHSPKIAEFEAQIRRMRDELDAASAAAADAAVRQPLLPPQNGPDPETLERIAAVQQRVNDLDQLRHRLGELEHLKSKVTEIDNLSERVSGVESLQQRLGELDGVEQRLSTIDGLAAQLQQLNARVAAQAELGGQISQLRDRMSVLSEQPRGADDDIRLQMQEIGERLANTEAMRAQVEQLAQRATSNDTEARAVREHMALLDQRLTNVSTELANQLSELGRDIDGLSQRAPEVADGNVSDELLETLRGGQAKLAAEQARYEIAFRQDLAALAEQLRKARGDS